MLAEEAVDKSGEIFDYATSKAHVEEWSAQFKKATEGRPAEAKSAGNLRAMHEGISAGKFLEVRCDDATKTVPVSFKVVDPVEKQKCVEGVYTGLSIGGAYVKRWEDPDRPGVFRYTAKLAEGSLVDNPCMYGATFQLIRAAGAAPEMRKFAGAERLEKIASLEAELAKLKKDGAPAEASAETPAPAEVKPATPAADPAKPADPAAAAASPNEPQDAAKAADVATLAKSVHEAIKSSTELMKAQFASLTDGLSKTVTETVDKAVKQATESHQKKLEDLGKRIDEVAATPAAIGRPAQPAQKGLGGTPGESTPLDADSIQKVLTTMKGKVPDQVLRDTALELAMHAMPR